jgi:hypothetical protein
VASPALGFQGPLEDPSRKYPDLKKLNYLVESKVRGTALIQLKRPLEASWVFLRRQSLGKMVHYLVIDLHFAGQRVSFAFII